MLLNFPNPGSLLKEGHHLAIETEQVQEALDENL